MQYAILFMITISRSVGFTGYSSYLVTCYLVCYYRLFQAHH